MKGFKFIVQMVNEKNEIITTKQYKNLREIEKDYNNIDYSQLRGIYLQTMGKTTRKQHPYIKQLNEKMKILDNPEYYKLIA
jgi:hypothetical protein